MRTGRIDASSRISSIIFSPKISFSIIPPSAETKDMRIAFPARELAWNSANYLTVGKLFFIGSENRNRGVEGLHTGPNTKYLDVTDRVISTLDIDQIGILNLNPEKLELCRSITC